MGQQASTQPAIFAPLVTTSSEWAKKTFTLLRGEIAWEVSDDNSVWYLLRGDGYPVNGAGPYTRLRVSFSEQPIELSAEFLKEQIWLPSVDTAAALDELYPPDNSMPDMEPEFNPVRLDADKKYLCRVTGEGRVYARRGGETAWLVYTEQTETLTVRRALEKILLQLDGAEKAFKQKDIDLDTKIDDEAEDRKRADDEFDVAIYSLDELIEERRREIIDIKDNVIGAALALFAEGANLKNVIESAVEAYNYAAKSYVDEAAGELKSHVKETYAPLESPHFSGVPTTPDFEKKQNAAGAWEVNPEQTANYRELNRIQQANENHFFAVDADPKKPEELFIIDCEPETALPDVFEYDRSAAAYHEQLWTLEKEVAELERLVLETAGGRLSVVDNRDDARQWWIVDAADPQDRFVFDWRGAVGYDDLDALAEGVGIAITRIERRLYELDERIDGALFAQDTEWIDT